MSSTGTRHNHFNVAIYTRAYEVVKMADLDWLAARFDLMQRHLKVNKVYLETHRDTVMADEATIEAGIPRRPRCGDRRRYYLHDQRAQSLRDLLLHAA
ncbi:MAG: hypothetical protein ACP5HG_08060 [Anaerolineae bacterium]